MNRRVLAWLAPLFLALIPLFHWGEDFRYSRFALLAGVLFFAWLFRPMHRISGKTLLLLGLGPVIAAVSWAVNGFPPLSPLAIAEMTATTLLVITLIADDAPEEYAVLWIASLSAASIYGLMQLLQIVALPLDAYGQPDAASTFGLSNFAAETLVVSIPLALALFARTETRWLRTLLPAAILLQVLYLLFADSRAGWIAFTAALIVALAVWRPQDRRWYWGSAIFLVLFVGTFIGLGKSRLNLLSESDPSLIFRREAWTASTKMAMDKPVFGVGPGRFPAYVGNYASEKLSSVSVRIRRSVHHPHNEYLNILAERGVVGALWLLTLLFATLAALFRRKAAWPLAGIVGGATVALFGFPFQQASFWAATGVLAALGLSTLRDENETPEPATNSLSLGLRIGVAFFCLGFALLFGIRSAASDLSRTAIVKMEAARRVAGSDENRAEVLRAQAAELLRSSLSLWPQDPEAVFNLAQASPFPEEKVSLLHSYLESMPGDLLSRLTLAQAQIGAKDKSGAEATLRDLIAKENAPPDAYHRLISLQVSQNLFVEAAKTATDGLQRFPGNKQLIVDAGDSNRLMGNHKQAVVYYDQLLAQNPSEPGFYLRAGLSQMALFNYPRAEEIFRKGNQLAPKDPIFLVFLARLENASDRRTEAKAHLLQALKYDPDLANNLKSDAPELIPLLNELKKNG